MPGQDTQPIFDRRTSFKDARVVVIPVPFHGTVSYRTGTEDGPAAIASASNQLDFAGYNFPGPAIHSAPSMELAEALTAMLEEDPDIRRLSGLVREAVDSMDRTETGAIAPGPRLDETNARCAQVHAWVQAQAEAVLREGKIPLVAGGEHSVSLGAIRACAEASREKPGGIGILQFDAHMDLRAAYQGLLDSHASIMRNAIERAPGVERLVQIGVRDFSIEERDIAHSDTRITSVTGWELSMARLGAISSSPATLIREAIDKLPEHVYLTIDIDGLDPALCPHTGTPVPGGLRFEELAFALMTLASSGRRIVGGDVVEVTPGPGSFDESFDASVGARVMCLLSQVMLLSVKATL